MTELQFLESIAGSPMTMFDRALALLWWAGRDDPTRGLTAATICGLVETAGHPKQNGSRLQGQLAADRRTSKAAGGAWRLHPKARAELDRSYDQHRTSRPIKASDSVLSRAMFRGTRGYLEKVVNQINASYDAGLYDCSAVMCRRVLETLLIELYEKHHRALEIKGGDGQFFMFSGLLGVFETDAQFHASRNTIRGLKDFKTLGDLSAHNRRFNASKDDIDRIRDGLRVAAEELLHMAGLVRDAGSA
jgi:hypothetical protein